LRSTPGYGHAARVITSFISIMQSDLRRFFFGARLALLRDRCFVELLSRKNKHRTSEIACVDTGNS
jgi:hypothetical protein